MSDAALKILILTDGKIGDLVQCRGVAAYLTDADRVEEHVVEPGWITALPLPYMPLSAVDRQLPFMGTDADIILASGRRTVPYLRALKARTGRSTFTVFLKDPTLNHASVDVIWAPAHDNLHKPNAFATATSPHAITAAKLAEARRSAQKRFADYPSPNVGLILGGATKSVDWGAASLQNLATQLTTLPAETNLLVTASRRTPHTLMDAVKEALKDYNTFVWESGDDNPYFEILAYCDRLIVTGDSHNMVSESLTSGRPVHIFRPENLHRKMHAFLDGLERDQLVQDISAGFARETGVVVDATPQICDEILQRYRARQAA